MRKGFGIVVVVVLGLATVARWWDVTPLPLTALQSLRWVFGLACAALLVLALLLRQRIMLLGCLILVLIHAVLAWPAFTGSASTATPTITVLASNTEYGQGDLTTITTAAREHHADVVILAEVTRRLGSALPDSELRRLLPHQVGQGKGDASGTVILSRWPMVVLATAIPGSMFDVPTVRLQTPSGPVTVVGVHAAPPTSPTAWHRELTVFAQFAAAQSGPTIMAGDFNASSDHPVFRRILDQATDAHDQVGAGWVRTWPRALPVPAFVQIDHLLSRGLRVLDAGAITVPGTDHQAVWASYNP